MGTFLGPPSSIGIVSSGIFGLSAAPPPPSSVTFSINAGANSNGPFNNPPNTYQFGWGVAGSTPSGSGAGSIVPPVVFVNGALLVAFGAIEDSVGSQFFLALCLAGGPFPQNWFTDVSYIDNNSNPQLFTSAAANFNTPWDETAGNFTIWTWQPVLPNVGFPNPITVTW